MLTDETDNERDREAGEQRDAEELSADGLLSREQILAAADDEGTEEERTILDAAAVGRVLNGRLTEITSLFRTPGANYAELGKRLSTTARPIIPKTSPALFAERPEIGLQRTVVRQQQAQNDVLLAMLDESRNEGRRTKLILVLTAISAAAAVAAVVVSLAFGPRTDTSTPGATPSPSPSISRSATP